MKYKCPNCETELYNRAQRLCRACGHALPADVLLSEVELRRFEESEAEQRKANRTVEVNLPVAIPIPPVGSGGF